jgi:hypothetical protein
MRIHLNLVFAAFALGLGAGCGSVSSLNDGGGGNAGGGAGGGAAGQGGATGAAGHGGATGQAGHGGAIGAAGHGGATGQAGHGGAGGGPSCDDLSAQYADAMPAAQRCEVGATSQCKKPVSSYLSPCSVNCMTYVNEDSTLNNIKQSWVQAGCDNVAVACPAIACLQPTSSTCVVGDGGGGVCSSANVGLPTN